MFTKLFRKPRTTVDEPVASLPAGQRIYAIGDIHGRLDLLEQLLARVAHDDRERGGAPGLYLFLGDLIDRGPESAQVVEYLRRLALAREEQTTRFLLGNHEEVFLMALEGDERALRFFTRIGGRETILSYGLTPEEYGELDYPNLLEALQRIVPVAHIDFLSRFEDLMVFGDYAFVHAGVRPQEPLARQRTKDLRWIREEFLRFPGKLEKVIVHGHTITDEVELLSNRIGLDTGAYASGKLTAMGFEKDQRWVLQTQPS